MGACLSLECSKCKLSADSHLLYCQKLTHQRKHCRYHSLNNNSICKHCQQHLPDKTTGCYHDFTYHIPFVKYVQLLDKDQY